MQRSIDCLDIFGASGRIKRTWEDAGFASLGFDVKISADHDLCSETGFFTLLHMGLQQLAFGFRTNIVSSPPGGLFMSVEFSIRYVRIIKSNLNLQVEKRRNYDLCSTMQLDGPGLQ